MKLRRVQRAGLAMAVAIGAAGALSPGPLPASASTAPPRVRAPIITMYSDPGDGVGHGIVSEFDPSNSTVRGFASAASIYFSISGGASADSASFDIEPPTGASLAVGYYPEAQDSASAAHPVLNVTRNSQACGPTRGWFEVRDIAFASGGAISRLSLLYEQHCGGREPALFGQIQIGESQPKHVIVASTSITWPPLGVPAAATPVPVYIRNTGSSTVRVGTAQVTGADSAVFSVSNDQCTNRALASKAVCTLLVHFQSSARGPHSAALILPMSTGQRVVQLDGVVAPGTTSLTMSSQPGDYVGGGQSYSYNPANATFNVFGGPSSVQVSLDGSGWTVFIVAPSGHVLAPGTYPNATGSPFGGSNPGLEIAGLGRGCNSDTGSFIVKQVAVSLADNSLQHFDATFIQRCVGSTAALTGEVMYSAVPTVTSPPGVTNLHATPTGNQVQLTWTNPPVLQWQDTIVRVQPAAAVNVAATTGSAVYSGTGSAATVSGLQHGASYWITAFTVDQWGNVSPPVELKVTGP